MQALKVSNKTRSVGGPGYFTLDVLDTKGEIANEMNTYWLPSPEELKALIQGAVIELTILGDVHPPVRLSVNSATVESRNVAP